MAGSSRVPRPQGPAPSARKPAAAPKPAPEAVDMSDIELGDGSAPQVVAPPPAVKKSTRTVAPPAVVGAPPAKTGNTGRMVAPPPAKTGNTARMVAAPPAKTGNTGRMVAPPPPAKTGNTARMVAAPPAKTGNTGRMVAPPPEQKPPTGTVKPPSGRTAPAEPAVKKGSTGPVKPPSGRVAEAPPQAAPAVVKAKGNTQRLTAPKPEAPAADNLVRLSPPQVEAAAPAEPQLVKPKGNTARLTKTSASQPKAEPEVAQDAPAKPKPATQSPPAPKPAADPGLATGHGTAVGLGTGKFDPLAETKLGASPVGAHSTGPLGPVSPEKTGALAATDAPADGEKKPEEGKLGAKKLGTFKPLAKGPEKPLTPLKAGGAIVKRAPVAPEAEKGSKLPILIGVVVLLLVLGGGGFAMMSGGPTQLIPDGDWAEKTSDDGQFAALLPKGDLKMPTLPAGVDAKVIGSSGEKGDFNVCALAVTEESLRKLDVSAITEQLGARFKGAKKGDELPVTVAGMSGTEVEFGNEARRAYVRFFLNEKKDRLYFLSAEVASPKRTVDVDKFFASFKLLGDAKPEPKEEPKETPKEEPK